jgi:hypothetical protein
MIMCIDKATATFVLALAATFSAMHVSAQIRPAYVKNVDQPGRVPYQLTVSFSNGSPGCITASACILSFDAVPAGKRLIVEQLTLMVSANGGPPTQVAFGDNFSTNTGNIAIVAPDFRAGSVVLGATFWMSASQVRVYYGPGETPKLKVFLPGTLGVVSNATVHGYLIDAVN